MTDILLLEHFQPHVGERFDLLLDDGSRYPLILLLAASTKSHTYPGKMREAFELRFAGTPDRLPQRTWSLENTALGRLDVFLVPIARQDGNIVYQAIYT